MNEVQEKAMAALMPHLDRFLDDYSTACVEKSTKLDIKEFLKSWHMERVKLAHHRLDGLWQLAKLFDMQVEPLVQEMLPFLENEDTRGVIKNAIEEIRAQGSLNDYCGTGAST